MVLKTLNEKLMDMKFGAPVSKAARTKRQASENNHFDRQAGGRGEGSRCDFCDSKVVPLDFPSVGTRRFRGGSPLNGFAYVI